jgi:hypothetical protein
MHVARPLVPRPAAPVRQLAAAKPPPARRAPSPRAGDGVDGDPSAGMHQAEIQLALTAQAARFDAMMKVLAEQQREINAIIDMGMAQAKRDDQLMNEWIRLI